MRHPYSLYLALSMCCYQSTAALAQIFKCTADDGSISFNDTGCPPQAQQDSISRQPVITIPAAPNSTVEHNPDTQQHRATRVTVITDDKHPCGAFDSTQRRTDLIRKQVKSGMSRAEVESMLGRPLSQRSHNGIVSAVYRNTKEQRLTVRFNQQGCVP
ncbi:MAG TPA: outer membrane protein assembly factor BamE [Thiopseudomonas sp.]|nr:outer membrane protein assembly factor BamE [Thiopseudomonas sp.]